MKINHSLSVLVVILVLLYNCNAFSSINIYSQFYKTQYAKPSFELKVAVYNEISSSKHTQRPCEVKTKYKLEVC